MERRGRRGGCWSNSFGDTCFHVPEPPGDAGPDPGRRENTLESCEIAFGRRVSRAGGPWKHQEPLTRPDDAPGGPQEVPGTESYEFSRVRETHDAESNVFSRAGEAPGGPMVPI